MVFVFLFGAIAALLIACSINFFIDPFGVFGDPVLKWYGYNITNNPRTGKIAYIDEHHNEYNSYIIGSSKTSSISPELLNKYYKDAKFYNMFMYGADLAHVEKTLKYLIDHYEVKNIVLNLGISELEKYNNETTDEKEELHAEVSGKPLMNFYLKYLTLNPSYSFEKIQAYISRDLMDKPNKYDVFLPQTGVYNKTKRDTENIPNINDYISQIGSNSFRNYDKFQTSKADKCLESIQRISDYCKAKDINLKVISSPNYDSELHAFNLEKVKDYWIRLSRITDFWNFSGYNEISKDPRYFYDSVHFRNLAGQMMLGKIFNDKDIYYPENFGVYMTKDNANELCNKILTPNNGFTSCLLSEKNTETVKVPILMYHHIVKDNESKNSATVSISKFRNDMEEIKRAGYTAIFVKDLISYVDGVAKLPEKPIAITFDDGYKSNYDYAFPILKELNMKATISIIGWSVGRDKRINSNEPILPHFNYQEALEMLQSGVIDIQSHSYNLHESTDKYPRRGSDIISNETTKDYCNVLVKDNEMEVKSMEENLKISPTVFTYPYGLSNILSEQIYKDLGYRATVVIGNKVSKIQKGNPYTLYGLNRIDVSEDISGEKLVEMIAKESDK